MKPRSQREIPCASCNKLVMVDSEVTAVTCGSCVTKRMSREQSIMPSQILEERAGGIIESKKRKGGRERGVGESR